MSIHTVTLGGHKGLLELLCSLPIDGSNDKTPLLFIHGSFCSAHCYMNFLPYLAQHGYPAYALSVRGHGASWAQSKLVKMLFTSMDSWAEDVQAALAHIGDAHPGAPPPVLGGHSLGGGVVQYMLSHGLVGGASTSNRISGLILLGAAPLFGGGKEMMANWGKAIPSDGYPVFFSERSLLHTPAHVRASFFSDETGEETVLKWMEQCKTMEESGRVGLSIFKSLGEADKVLTALDGLGTSDKSRRVFCIAGSEDKLVTPSLVLSNASGYEDVADDIGMDREACMTTIIGGSGHHLMMDAHWEICAQAVLSWLGGEAVSQTS